MLSTAGRRELHVLNHTAAELWAVCAEGADDDHVTRCQAFLRETYGLGEAEAGAHAAGMVGKWRAASLLGSAEASGPDLASDEYGLPADLPLKPVQPQQIGFDVGSCPLALDIPDAHLMHAVQSLLPSMLKAGVSACRHLIRVTGTAGRWFLSIDGAEVYCGATADEAAVSVMSQSLYLAFRAVDNLLVVHGAGVANSRGAAALLVAPSGSGKTTLSAALNARGYSLLNDDVVPVDLGGRLRSLSSPLCIKRGSWDLLAAYRPDLEPLPEVQRFGRRVKLLPPTGEQPGQPTDCRYILFPSYLPGAPPACTRITPEETLQKLVAARPFLRVMDQDRLSRLANWIGAIPAHALSFPNLESGLALVDSLMSA